MELKNSRGLFFAQTREPQISYWANPKMLKLVEGSRRTIPSEFLNWNPCAPDSRSNCPQLHSTMEMLVNLSNPKWRDRASNIYAGRIYSNEDVAEAQTNLRGGMIAISNEYSSAITAYAAMYGRFVSAIDFAAGITQEQSRLLWTGLHDHFNKSIEDFKRGGIISLKGNDLMVFPDDEARSSFESAIFMAEFWTVAHEFSHHIVRDVSTRRDREVVTILRDLTKASSVGEEIRAMSSDQRDEINADLLATLLVSGYFNDTRDPIGVPGAISGAALSLITIAHFRDEWTCDPEDSHPGCLDRIRILLTLICEYYGSESAYPGDSERSHIVVRRVAGLLITFALWVHGSIGMDSKSINNSIATLSVIFEFMENED
ncbi:hypothetical protein [Rhodococcus qingshengii]|uniref:hypothetical protein n=1 Tax=Rhodococcus qingshengii TaxID=334542 RepID=UPI002AFE4E1D|nr:hypothetical protein [Rhodococcus qingshengii]MEA1798603.1 hypothetical protein [Rhodococcus qingshengii]